MGLYIFLRFDCNLDNSIHLIFKEVVSLLNICQLIAVCDQRGGINFALFNQAENLCAVTSVDAAGFEGQILAVHIRQGQILGLIVEGHYGDDGVGAGALPCQVEGILGTGHFQYHIGAAVVGVGKGERLAVLRRAGQHIGVMRFHKGDAGGILLADDDLFGVLQHDTQQGADACGTCADDKDGVLGGDLTDSCGPETGGQHIADEQRLLVSDRVGDFIQTLVCIGYPDEFCLTAIHAAAQRPAAIGVGAVIDKTLPAEKVPETDEEPEEITELIFGNKFASGFSQRNRASSRINYYLKAGTVITLKDPDIFQWACTKTGNETSTDNRGYFPDASWSDKDTAVVNADGWVGFVFKYREESQEFDLSKPLSDYISIEEPQSMSLRYDDRLDMTGKTVAIIDAGAPTSYQVGYGVEENAVSDTAVVTLKGDTLAATGIGTARVKIDGEVFEITVTAAPISLLLLIGQSNMEGNEGEAKQSIVCPDGMVYATYGDRYEMVLENATHYAPSALTGEYRTVNTVGGTDGLSDYPVYMLTDEGDGRKGPDSGFAYEWVQQTGEKVWIVNASHGGTSLDVWQPGTTQYEECEAMFGACQETLRKEIAAGHFTLRHMGYFWCQGCNDYDKTAEWYVKKYLSMHESLNAEMSFDHDGDASTPAKEFEFAGIIPVRAGHSWRSGYRAGTYTDTTNKSGYESFVDLQMTGPRVAQYWMCNNAELEDIWLVCNIGEDWVWMPDGTNGVSAYFNAHYPNGTVDYTTQVQQSASWYQPTTPNAVHDSIHYNQIGYNEVGRESVRNALIYLGINPDYEEETTVKFVDWTGYREVDVIEASTSGSSGTLVVPIVSPVTRSKTVSYAIPEDLSYVYYDLLARSVNVAGELNAVGASGSVSVVPRSLDSYSWSFDGANLISDPAEGDLDNPLTLLGGSVADGVFNGLRYQLSRSICLNHDSEWGLEVKLSDWSASTGSMILSGGSAATSGQPYLYFRPTDFFVGFGYYDGKQYNNYGVSLKQYGIACNEGTHTYRFVNRIADDGTNSIWLYVDDEEIAPLTEYFINSTLTDANSTGLSGKDFVLSYIGTSDFAVKGCVIDGICAVEAGYDPSIHLHTWSEWMTLSLPSAKGSGSDQRSCIQCGKTQSRSVDGVWQIYDLDEHMTDLPESYCAETNLWPILPHDREYYHSGVRWDVNGNVRSVTFAVSGGEWIYATSFGKRVTNGAPSSDGIRLTFFGEDGVLKTTAPQETYAEFTANGGYIVVPEGAVAVNVPMYSDSNENELYILNRAHRYDNGTCAGCGGYVGPVITRQPESVQQELGKKFAITVQAEGEGLSYQWYVKESGAKAFKVSSNKTSSYAYTMQHYMHNRQVYCVVTDANGNQVTTETATITRPPEAVKIVKQPASVRAELGKNFSVSVQAEGEGLTYQWYYKNAGSRNFAASSNRTSAYAYSMQSYMVDRQVYCVITDKYGNSVTTDVATISLPARELMILTQPRDAYASLGEKFSIAPEVQGEGLTYQWYYKNAGGKSFAASSNKTAAYAYSMQSYMNGRCVYCVITDQYGNTVQTQTVTIHIR